MWKYFKIKRIFFILNEKIFCFALNFLYIKNSQMDNLPNKNNNQNKIYSF